MFFRIDPEATDHQKCTERYEEAKLGLRTGTVVSLHGVKQLQDLILTWADMF